MNCFYHPDQPALGLCKSCGRGLCHSCMTEMEDGLACKNRCEERVELINQIIDSNKQVLSVANVQSRSSTAFMIIMGVVFCAIGFFSFFISSQKFGLLPGSMGLIFLITGLLRLRQKAKFPELK